MKVTFVRTVGARDRVYVERDDGTTASWVFPTYGDAPPHDLVHLIAEVELGLTDGLWARVAAGADLATINAQADRAGGKLADKSAALGEGVLRSEQAAAALSSSYPEPAAWIDPAALARARARLAEVGAAWRALVPKGALAFAWPSGARIS
jgi:hypothetical protein